MSSPCLLLRVLESDNTSSQKPSLNLQKKLG